MVFNIKPYERKIFELIQLSAKELEYPVYVVGGYVRDRLLARESNDLDVVCVGDGIALAEKLATKLIPTPYIAVYRRFGTAMIRHKDIEIEFVGARKESYSIDSRKPAVENGTLEDDQNRRDFTINALAVSLNEDDYGEIKDPFNGFHDLENKIIRTPLDPDKTFADDPLRMMRAIRFSTQLDFEIEAVTLKSIAKNKHRISIVSKERISAELEKIILSDRSSKGFKLLFNTGLLHIIFPEMAALQGVEIRNNIGHKDNFYHTLEVLENVSKDSNNLWLRWAAILHDIAKPPTKRFDPELGWTFHGHEALGAAMVPRIFKKMKLPLDAKMKYVQKLVLLHLRPIALTNDKVSDSAVRRLLFDAGEFIDDLLTLCKADITSKNEGKVNRYKENYRVLNQKIKEVEEKDHLRNWQPPITGDDIMRIFKLPPSREVGILKTAIREAILDGVVNNNYDDAYAFMMQKARELNMT
ncbi:MAG: HD domain-containing protein [Saprospiraceae bacterium]|jgi:poly(A) polymerase|nr:HD domain-containing protein [Saprospiraceae bacterium]MBP6238341.1 HD domain-containing protein [Saprospiraceae bacterium]MBP6566832.1 HD domain-containing protein [Saprospiraceae bacterium]